MKLEFDNIIITGPTGWLGRQLCKTLLDGDDRVLSEFVPGGYRIRALVLPHEYDTITKDDIFRGIEFIKGDLKSKTDIEQLFRGMEGNTLVVHTAGIIHPKRVSEFYTINVEGTRHLVDSAIAKGTKKIVVISSNSPIGCNKDNKSLFTEDTPYNPYMGYGKSKKQMELYLKNKISEGVDITILRPPWFYGENQPERQLTFYQMVKDGKFPFVGDGTNLRSKANVKNICQGILLAATLEVSRGKIYWIADENAYSMKEIVTTVSEVLSKEFGMKTKDNKKHLPFIVGQVAQVVDATLQSLGLYHQKIHVLSELNKNIACSIEKAQNELGYAPKVNLYDGVKEALNYNTDYKKLV